MPSKHSSRLVSRPHGTKSFYRQLRAGGGAGVDFNNTYGDDGVDEENWERQFHEEDLDQMRYIGTEGSSVTMDVGAKPVGASFNNEYRGTDATPGTGVHPATRWQSQDDEVDNDVPASLLVERHEPARPHPETDKQREPQSTLPPRKAQSSWDRAQAEQPLYDVPPPTKPTRTRGTSAIAAGNMREKALWRWASVSNLDVFMKDVYEYYLGSGFWCILCERVLHLVQSAFIVIFLTFLTQCIDYSLIRGDGALSQVVIGQCTKHMTWYWNLGLWLFVFYFVWKTVQFSVDIRRLVIMRDFYVHLLEIPEQDMQTVSWQDIVARVMALRDANPSTAMNMSPLQRKWLQAHSKERLDAIDIASRIMRKDNYLIALINKDILDLSLPVPLMRNRQLFSGTLQWWLYFSVIDLVFDHNGQVNQQFLKSSSRGLLSRKLHDRFVAAGLLNLLGSPFWVCYQVLFHLLSYYNEFKKDSSTLSDRRYTALAKWKFREFNELPHFFQERINMSYPFASRYMDQFPKRLVEQIAQAVTFMSGAITFVLAAASFLEPDIVLTFDITYQRPALFYIGVFGTIWAIARGMISEDTMVFNPEFALKGVTDFIHYIPDHWQGRLHSFDVKREFSELYKLKLVILAEEILGIFLASFVLMYSAPKSSERIIDFFREFTIHVDGLGYVCSFAEFDFKRGAVEHRQHPPDADDVRGGYYSTKHGKMAASYYGFLENYVHHPKTGMPGGHMPPSLRQQFYPPPTFPGLNSPTLGVDIRGLKGGRDQGQAARNPRTRPSIAAPSPMASVLLDPHHQPPAQAFGLHSPYATRARNDRGEHQVKQSMVREPAQVAEGEEDELYESGGPLGESIWQTSPMKPLSRESSECTGPSQDTGVLGLIYQFQQVNRDNRMGGGG